MGRSQESFQKKEVRNKKEKKRKEKEAKRLAKRDNDSKNSLDDMIAYVDENGVIMTTPPDESNKTEIKVEDIQVSVPRGENETEETVKTGVVSYFNEPKGYGFIKDINTKFDYFFHVNNLLENVKEGNQVLFEIENGQRGPTAVKIQIDKK